MKSLLLIIVAIAVVASVAVAGDDAAPKTKSEDKALLFTLGGLSNLSAGNFMGGLGAKYYVSDKNAVRIGLGFGTTSTTTKYTGPVLPNTSDNKVTTTGFGVTPGFMHLMTSEGPVAAYIGAQLNLSLLSTTNENPGFVSNNKNKSSTTSFGVGGVLGVEWFAWSNVSFGAEYILTYASGSGTNEVTVGGTTTSTDTPSTNTFVLGSASSGNLILAIFW